MPAEAFEDRGHVGIGGSDQQRISAAGVQRAYSTRLCVLVGGGNARIAAVMSCGPVRRGTVGRSLAASASAAFAAGLTGPGKPSIWLGAMANRSTAAGGPAGRTRLIWSGMTMVRPVASVTSAAVALHAVNSTIATYSHPDANAQRFIGSISSSGGYIQSDITAMADACRARWPRAKPWIADHAGNGPLFALAG